MELKRCARFRWVVAKRRLEQARKKLTLHPALEKGVRRLRFTSDTHGIRLAVLDEDRARLWMTPSSFSYRARFFINC